MEFNQYKKYHVIGQSPILSIAQYVKKSKIWKNGIILPKIEIMEI